MNRRDQCAARLRTLEQELEHLHDFDVESEEVLGYVREGAAHIERFLKRLTIQVDTATLNGHIEALERDGLPSDSVAALHALRRTANAGKHDASAAITLDEARNLLRDARSAVAEIGVAGCAPGAAAPAPVDETRLFAILVADYPTGGETDYQIGFLTDEGRFLPIDHYQARYTDEEVIVQELKEHGELDQVPSDPVAAKLSESLSSSSEFGGVWTYEGDLGRVAAAFSAHQHSEAIDLLQRPHSPAAVRSAVAMSCVDLGERADIAEAISAQVESSYAVGAGHTAPLAQRAATLVASASPSELRGPRLVSSKRFSMLALSSIASDSGAGLAIMSDGMVVVDVGDGSIPMS